MGEYENQLSNWSRRESALLTIQNYTPAQNISQTTLCLETLGKYSSYRGRFDDQMKNLKEEWSSYDRLLVVLKAKNLSLTLYRIQIDQEVRRLLSDLYDYVQPGIDIVQANCRQNTENLLEWEKTYASVKDEVNRLNSFLDFIGSQFSKYQNLGKKLIPQIGKVTQIVGGCQVQILNYDPTFRWYAKGDLVIDINGIGTILNGSLDQYLSTDKPGYQIVNHIEGMFKCPGTPKIADNAVDVTAPIISLISLSKTELYKGESFEVIVLITDNKHVNNFSISLYDQIGQNFTCYDGVAWKMLSKGDDKSGVYVVECTVRTVSYDGIWSLTGIASDGNFNASRSKELSKIRILYGEAPKSSLSVANQSPTPQESLKERFSGTALLVSERLKYNLGNSSELKSYLLMIKTVSNLSRVTKLKSEPTLKTIYQQLNVVIETPKVCSYEKGVIFRKTRGTCRGSFEFRDNVGNQYLISKQVVFK